MNKNKKLFYEDFLKIIEEVDFMVRGHVKKEPKKPDFVDEQKVVYDFGMARFVLYLLRSNPDEELSEDNPYVVRLRRSFMTDKKKGEWRNDTINIRYVEDWERIKQVIDVDFADKLGWLSKDEALNKIEKEQSTKTVKEVVDKRPTLALDFLEESDLERMDLNQLTELIWRMSKKDREINKKFISLFHDIIEKSTEKDERYIERFNDIVNRISLQGIYSTMDYVLYRLARIDLLEQMITDSETYEIKGKESIHRFLEKNIWILDESYNVLTSNQSLKTLIKERISKKYKKYERKRPDFASTTYRDKLVIAEIKKPSHELAIEDLDQIELYLTIAEEHKGEEYRETEGFLIVKSVPSDLRKFAERRMNVYLKTYQEVVQEVRERYNQFHRILEEEMEDFNMSESS